MVDWDEDGDVDLICGESDGHVHYFQNIGSLTNPVLTNRGHVQANGVDIDVGSLAVPVVHDYDEDGRKDLILGQDPAGIRLYLNVGTNAAPVFNGYAQLPLYPAMTQIKNAPDIGDLNGDGLKDLVFGWWQGTAVFYPNYGTNAAPVFNGAYDLSALGTTIDPGGWTHLELNDWDEDGDLDLLIGEWYGDVFLHKNVTNLMNVTVTPQGGPIVIPPTGGVFNFDAALSNGTAFPASLNAWIKQRLPSGQWQGPLLGPLVLNMPGGASVARSRSQNVPPGAPAGAYAYVGYLGQYAINAIWDSSSFLYSVGSDGFGPRAEDGWACTGEPFPGEGSVTPLLPSSLTLKTFPNPFNPVTALGYRLPVSGYVTLRVYDTAGREVRALVDGWREAGAHEVTFDAAGLPSGIYFARLQAGDFTAIQKMMLVK